MGVEFDFGLFSDRNDEDNKATWLSDSNEFLDCSDVRFWVYWVSISSESDVFNSVHARNRRNTVIRERKFGYVCVSASQIIEYKIGRPVVIEIDW